MKNKMNKLKLGVLILLQCWACAESPKENAPGLPL